MAQAGENGRVVATAADPRHRFSKTPSAAITIIAGIGVAGDAHAGELVQHQSRVRADPTQPNLRQVHLIHAELLDELALNGFAVAPGQLGENITTTGIDLLGLSRGTLLAVGDTVVLEVTGLRNPCRQIESFRPGLLARLARKRSDGSIERLGGIMAVALCGGTISVGDVIRVQPPAEPFEALGPV